MRILSFDIEEWFHLLENESTSTQEQWEAFPVRIHQNVDRILDILEDTDTPATFFVIGWIARKYPEVVRKIARRHEIGSHTMLHELVWGRERAAFAEDLTGSMKLLEDVTGKPVKYFRAPGFSIRETEPWAFEVINECGIEVDCSVFPARHAHGGIAGYGQARPSVIQYNGCRVKELPVCLHRFAGRDIIFSGGGYFRLLPYPLIKKWTSGKDYVMSYIHPRDLDPGQPMLEGLSAARKFKSYVGVGNAEKKLRRWLADFPFTDIAGANASIDWNTVPVVNLD